MSTNNREPPKLSTQAAALLSEISEFDHAELERASQHASNIASSFQSVVDRFNNKRSTVDKKGTNVVVLGANLVQQAKTVGAEVEGRTITLLGYFSQLESLMDDLDDMLLANVAHIHTNKSVFGHCKSVVEKVVSATEALAITNTFMAIVHRAMSSRPDNNDGDEPS